MFKLAPPLLVVALFVALSGWAVAGQARAPSPPDGPMPVIVALGDSITAGFGLNPEENYPARLQQKLTRAGYRYRVVNAGVPGDTTGGGLRRLEQALVPGTRILILELGATDGLRGLPIHEVQGNLGRIIEAAQARQIDVLLCTMEAPPSPADELEYGVEFHKIYVKLQQRYRVPRVPFVLINVFADPSLTLSDRMQPNAEGAEAVAEALWRFLEPMVAQRQK
jgi:acyl-CoA thioesterase I